LEKRHDPWVTISFEKFPTNVSHGIRSLLIRKGALYIVKKDKPHSLEFFTHSRNFWWNSDFLKLFIKRWKLTVVKDVLDVGCGQGHWINALLPLFNRKITVTGIDKDSNHIDNATKNFKDMRKHNVRFRVGDAYSLPFDNDIFDMVTCQTLLIHLAEPKKAIAEMVRVTKPNGLIAIIEPNNSYRAISGISSGFRLEKAMRRVRDELVYEKGKMLQKCGFDSYGESVLADLVGLGLYDLQAYISDKCTIFLPPYTDQESYATIDEIKSNKGPQKTEFDGELDRYVLGGGTKAEFALMMRKRRAERRVTQKAIDKREYSSLSASVMLLVSGRKPATANTSTIPVAAI
jgi:ubiquinone/menaquinone biosynthesis C-methylase UbiE